MRNTKELIKKYGLRLVKSLGQNFLTDESVIDKIVDCGEIDENDFVIEVGPGIGNMTEKLCDKAGYVVAVEIDKNLVPILDDVMKTHANFDLIHGDILKMDIKNEILVPYASKIKEGASIKVIANLPYYITTPIIMKFLEEECSVSTMVFMVQKEVADRMASNPGCKEYGAFSVAVQYYAEPQKMFAVPPDVFVPKPEVDSTVIRLKAHTQPPALILDKKMFFKVVKAAFGQRRKTLVNALSNSGYFNLSKIEIVELLKNMELSENIRGEMLSIMQFGNLANSFVKKNIKDS